MGGIRRNMDEKGHKDTNKNQKREYYNNYSQKALHQIGSDRRTIRREFFISCGIVKLAPITRRERHAATLWMEGRH